MIQTVLMGCWLIVCTQITKAADDPKTFLYGDALPPAKPSKTISPETINHLKNDLFKRSPSSSRLSKDFEKKLQKMNEEFAADTVRLTTVLSHLFYAKTDQEKYNIFQHVTWKLKSRL